MELYQLRAFAAVAEEGNVTRAAERLFTSQPAVSAQIKALEQEFGFELFLRTPAGMRLTPDGERLLQQTRSLLQQARGMEDLARHLRDGVGGALRIGLNCPVTRLRFDELARHLLAQHPQLQLHVIGAPTGEIVRRLKAYTLDVGFGEGPLPTDLHGVALPDTQVRVIVPRAWELDDRTADWSALARRPWVFASADCSYYRLMERLSQEHGLQLQEQFRVDEEGTTVQFVQSGLAASLTDLQTAEHAVAGGQAVIWPHFQATLPHQAIALARRAQEPAIASFFAACRLVFPRCDTPAETLQPTPARRAPRRSRYRTLP